MTRSAGHHVAMTTRPTLSAQVAEEIRALLARRRISGRHLAEATGMSQSAISARLTGATAIDLDDLQRIAAALDVRVLDLFPVEVAEPTPAVSTRPRVVTRAGEPNPHRLTSRYPGSTHIVTSPPPNELRPQTTRSHPGSPDQASTRPQPSTHHPRPVRLSRPAGPRPQGPDRPMTTA